MVTTHLKMTEKSKKGNEIKLGSLFTGVGGFDLAADREGISTVWVCEIEQDCRDLLKVYFPKAKQYADVKKVKNPSKVDIICGGFPCQDISVANVSSKQAIGKNGKAKGIKGERSGLWKEMYRIIGEVRPSYVVLENSPMLVARGLKEVVKDLAKIGYCLEWQILSARQFGYNHLRKRFYGIAYPQQDGQLHTDEVFSILQKILPKRTSRQNFVPSGFKRFNATSNYQNVRIHDGFSEGMDEKTKRCIEVMGNAVVVDIPQFIFKAIKIHKSRSKKHVKHPR